MVLDVKVMEWATQHGLDTAALKKAKIPIYGKWYFPDLPANTPLVNMRTGEVERFPAGYRAGAILYVREDDLKQAGLGPYKAAPAPAAPPASAEDTPVPAPARLATPTASPARPAPAQAAPRPAAPTAPSVATAAPSPGASGHATAGHGPSSGHGPAAAAHSADLAEASHGIPTNEHAHPTSKKYVQIAIILAIITAVEVALYYIPNMPSGLLFWILMALSTVKFYTVAAFFMHLKFDHTSFTGYFVGGMALAMAIFLGLLALQYATHGAPSGF